ncbi:MAG: TRAP transporter substrate-binding protein DctP [Rhizobiaceae bacterium]|nr:TRAP transporter substrate-binding protein DctP [Rhizobiaceae bacterium]
MFKIIKAIAFASTLALTMGGAGGGAGLASADEITLSGANCFPLGSPVGVPFENVVAEINKRGKGILQIDLKGGAPAIGDPFTIVQKMTRSVYDIAGCPGAFFGNVFPEAPVLDYTQHPYHVLRKNGAMDLLTEMMVKKNIQFIGRYHDFGPFHLWLNEKIDKPDLTGLHLRVSPVYTPFFKAMGATVQVSNISQVYTYMENNTVKGYGWPALGWVPSWVEVTKYRVEPGFYSAPLFVLMNSKKWNSLTDEQRNVVTSVVAEFEARTEPDSDELLAALKKQKDWMSSKGLDAITFTGADAEKWLKTASDAGWAQVFKRTPEHAEELRKLLSK